MKLFIFITNVLVFFLFVFCSVLYIPNKTASDPSCTLEQFGGDRHGYHACMALAALQNNWYPSPHAGLYKYPTWNSFDGFWQDGAAMETLANFMFYTNSTMFKDIVYNSVRNLSVLTSAYLPQPSYDDIAWYGLTYSRIYEASTVEDNIQLMERQNADDNIKNIFLNESINIFKWIWRDGWDWNMTCGGGFWFDWQRNHKNTVENAQMFQLAGRLARLTGDKSIILYLNETWKFIENIGLINYTTYLVCDKITTECSGDGMYGPSYNMGLIIGGLIEAGPALNRTTDFMSLAHRIAESTIKFLVKNNIFWEYCEPSCDDDEKFFKGIFVRNLRYLIDASRKEKKSFANQKQIDFYMNFIHYNSDAAWKYSVCYPENTTCKILYKDGDPPLSIGPIFGTQFNGPFDIGAPMQQTATLDFFIAGISPETTCRGYGCDYNPPSTSQRSLTCNDDPCPIGQPCCGTSVSYTCCSSSQQCINNVCYPY